MATLSIINAILPQGQIRWDDTDTIENRTGSSSNIVVEQTYGIYDPEAEIIPVWEYFNGTSWVDSGFAGGSLTKTFTGLVNGINKFRIKLVQQYNSNAIIGYSNVLQYTFSTQNPSAIVSQDSAGTNLNDIHSSAQNVYIYVSSIQAYNGATIVSATWQYMNVSTGGSWIDDTAAIVGSGYAHRTYDEDYAFRVKVIDSNGLIGYSNELRKYYSGFVTQSFWYKGLWGAGDTIHDPEVNSWVKYIDQNGVEDTQIIGPIEWGCQEVVASSIVQTNGVATCTPKKDALMISSGYTLTAPCNANLLLNNYYIYRGGRLGTDIQSGDIVYSTNTNVFDGQGKSYLMQLSIVPTQDPSYIGNIDSNGTISLTAICPGI